MKAPLPAPPVSAPPLSLDAIYRAHFDFVYRAAARLGGPGFDAEDAAQEVFVIAGNKLHTFDGTSAVTTWLFGIALNVVRRARRRAMVRRLFAERRRHELDESAVDPDRVAIGEARAIAYAILDKLSTKHREVFILSEFEELTCEEIATIVDCKLATVWSRLHYARKEFARRLAVRVPQEDRGIKKEPGSEE